MPNNTINGIHAQRLKDIRPYVNFNFDLRKPLSTYAKRKIKRYWDEIDRLSSRPHQIYRPRRKDHLQKAQAFAQQDKPLRGLKVAFIPNNGPKGKVHFTPSGEIKFKSEFVTTSLIEFDIPELIDDPAEHVRQKIKHRTENSYTVQAGDFELPIGVDKKLLPEFVAELTTRYNNDTANNYFANWLHGVHAHQFDMQDEFNHYLREKQRAKNKLRKQRRAKRERQRRRRSL